MPPWVDGSRDTMTRFSNALEGFSFRDASVVILIALVITTIVMSGDIYRWLRKKKR